MADSSIDYNTLQTKAARIDQIMQLLEEKEMRWLELSELM